jgi:hypothetical protein
MFEGEFKLDDKHCDLGVALGTPTQKHGDERLPAKVLGFSGVPMGKDEINDFFGDKHAWDMLYVEAKGKPAKDFWLDKLAIEIPLAVKKFKNCNVVLKFGVSCEVSFTDCTIKSGRIRRTEGGITLLSFTLVCLKSHIRGDLARLDEFLSQSANVSIEFGDPSDDEDEDDDEDQDELDLDHQNVAAAANGNVKQEKVDTSKRRRKPTDGATVN